MLSHRTRRRRQPRRSQGFGVRSVLLTSTGPTAAIAVRERALCRVREGPAGTRATIARRAEERPLWVFLAMTVLVVATLAVTTGCSGGDHSGPTAPLPPAPPPPPSGSEVDFGAGFVGTTVDFTCGGTFSAVRARERGLSWDLQYKVPPDLWAGSGSHPFLAGVGWNGGSNSPQFTSPEGRVRLEVRVFDAAEGQVVRLWGLAYISPPPEFRTVWRGEAACEVTFTS